MKVELLVVADCSHENDASVLLRGALDDIGLRGTAIVTTVITTQRQAEERGFTGSPTVLLNGHDPFTEPAQPPGLACRIYPGPSGPTGVPTLSALREALKREAEPPA